MKHNNRNSKSTPVTSSSKSIKTTRRSKREIIQNPEKESDSDSDRFSIYENMTQRGGRMLFEEGYSYTIFKRYGDISELFSLFCFFIISN